MQEKVSAVYEVWIKYNVPLNISVWHDKSYTCIQCIVICAYTCMHLHIIYNIYLPVNSQVLYKVYHIMVIFIVLTHFCSQNLMYYFLIYMYMYLRTAELLSMEEQ